MSQQLYLIVIIHITLSIAIGQLDYGFFGELFFIGIKSKFPIFIISKEDPLDSIQCNFNAIPQRIYIFSNEKKELVLQLFLAGIELISTQCWYFSRHNFMDKMIRTKNPNVIYAFKKKRFLNKIKLL